MSIIKNDTILGYIIGSKYVCRICVTKEEWEKATIDEIITVDDCVIKDAYSCDRCIKRI